MAQSKSASGTKKNTSAKARAKKPIRREVGSVVCLALGLFTLIGYFVKDYWLIDGLCLYVFKGLFGWGFLVVPPCFLWAAVILGFHRGRPVTGRIVALSFIPLLFGAAVHLLACKVEYGFDWLSIRSLFYGGMNLETGGVVSGLFSIFLERAVSVYGALPVFVIALFGVICVAANVSLREKVEDRKSRPRTEYEPMPEPVPEKPRTKKERGMQRERAQELPVPEIFAVPEPANAPAPHEEAGGIFSRRRKKEAIDIPMEDGWRRFQREIPACDFAEEQAAVDAAAPGVRTGDFVCGGEEKAPTAQDAIQLARQECALEYDTVEVAFDPQEQLWRVYFSRAGSAGGDAAVWLSADGVTRLVVCGE